MLQLATATMINTAIWFKYSVTVRCSDADGEICDLYETNSWTRACEFVSKHGPNLNGKSIEIEENY